MTELERLVENNLYEEITVLEDDRSIVRDIPTNRFYYKKVLSVYYTGVFSWLQAHPGRFVPNIQAFWQDGDRLVVIEELIQGRTLDEVSYSIGGMQATNITAYVQGGPPDGSIILTFEIIDSVTGQHTRWSGSDPVKRGGEESVYYSKDTLEYDLFDREHTVRVYGDDGSLLTTWTGKFKKSFDWEDSMRKED